MTDALTEKERSVVRAVQSVHRELAPILAGGDVVAIAGVVTVRQPDGSESTGRFNLGGDRRGQKTPARTLRLPDSRRTT